MPYASDRDRDPHHLEIETAPWPAPPLNLFLTSGFQPGVFDLLWDDPGKLSRNQRFHICGVNVYRSFDSEFGPFERITDLPVGSIFWRDQTDNVMEVEEIVEDDFWVLRGESTASQLATQRFVFRTRKGPIVKAGSQALPTTNIDDVVVRVDGELASIKSVNGSSCEIEIDIFPHPDVATQMRDPVVLPGPNSVVTVTYRYNRTLLRTDLAQRVFYRVTTVGVPSLVPVHRCRTTDMVETPLERAAATSNAEIEKIDYIWREAVRRNHWILQEGGERVKVFLRKHVGQPCPCEGNHQYKQPINDCELCFGTTILGGYEGPYDIVLAPDDAERRIAQRDTGRTVEHSYEVWTGPRPLLSMRDFVVKINGDRYSVGAVRMPTNRGMILQQHFMIGHIDEKDIRHRVPVDTPRGFTVNELEPVVPPQHMPPKDHTDKPNIPDEREIRGRTVTWTNITY